MLIVYTATTVYCSRPAHVGPDGVDVGASLFGGPGALLRASQRLHGELIDVGRQLRSDREVAMKRLAEARDLLAHAERQADQRWNRARARYVDEMRASWRTHRAAWEALLAWPRVTLVCVCPDVRRCHRATLAAVLERFGAVYVGERDPTVNVAMGDDLRVPPPIDWQGRTPPGQRPPREPVREPPPSSHRPRGG